MKNTVKIKLNCEFKKLYYQGKFRASRNVVTYATKGKKGINRIGITTGKKIGNAVKRNRARRLIFSAYSALEPTLPLGFDFVFVARENITNVKMDVVKNDMQKQIEFLTKK